MQIRKETRNNARIAIVTSDEMIISNPQEALDLIAMVHYDHDCNSVVIHKRNITEDFFDLSNRLAGDILQKFSNYEMALAMIGDFDAYDSKSLKSFIYESNKGRRVLFKKTEAEALEVFGSL